MDIKARIRAFREFAKKILQAHRGAVEDHGACAVFDVLRKGESTGYNEMNEGIALARLEFYLDPEGDRPTQTAKLSVVDWAIGMIITGNLTPLELLCSFFGRACPEIPKPGSIEKEGMLKLAQEATQEHADILNEVLEAAQDNDLSYREAEKWMKESWDAININSKIFHIAVDRIAKGQG